MMLKPLRNISRVMMVKLPPQKKNVAKFSYNQVDIPIGQAINGSEFLRVKLCTKHKNENLEKSVKDAASIIASKAELKMDGKEVYVTVETPTKQEKDDNGESRKAKSFIQKYQKELVQNLELNKLLAIPEIKVFFDEKDIATIKSIPERRNKAKQFLDMCYKLPNRGMAVVFPHLKESVPPSDTIHDSLELDTLRNWIEQHQESLLEEMDSPFIESTIKYMEDVPNEAKASWEDGRKSRKQRVQHFLEFVLKRDDGVMALEKTMKENEMFFDEN